MQPYAIKTSSRSNRMREKDKSTKAFFTATFNRAKAVWLKFPVFVFHPTVFYIKAHAKTITHTVL